MSAASNRSGWWESDHDVHEWEDLGSGAYVKRSNTGTLFLHANDPELPSDVVALSAPGGINKLLRYIERCQDREEQIRAAQDEAPEQRD